MFIDDLTKGLKNKLDEVMGISNSVSILNIPKQSLLDKGEMVILLNDKKKPIIVEFLKVGKYHVEFKNSTFPKLLVEEILDNSALQLFPTETKDEMFDTDYFVNYSDLSTTTKKEIRNFVKNAEKKLYNEHLRFGKMSEASLKKTISVQNGAFTVWMTERGFDEPNKDCIIEAYKEASETNDIHLKKRAAAAKCFHKIYTGRTNGKK